MRKVLLRWAIGLASLFLVLLVWLIFGRQIVLLVDRIATCEIKSLPVTELRYEGAGESGLIQVADITLNTYSTNGTQLKVGPDGQNRLVISQTGKSFRFGPLLAEGTSGGTLAGAPDPGDQVRISVQRSHFAWPTPFEFNFMTGRSRLGNATATIA